MKRLLPIVFATALVPGVALAQARTAPAAPAQAAQQPQLTPQQQALIDGQNRQMTQGAQAVVQMVDQGQIGEVWDGASSVAKASVGRAAFVNQTLTDRKALGAVRSRAVRAITRSRSSGGKVPAGDYINVAFATQFASQQAPVRELVSFHLDSDGKWRVAGYTVH